MRGTGKAPNVQGNSRGPSWDQQGARHSIAKRQQKYDASNIRRYCVRVGHDSDNGVDGSSYVFRRRSGWSVQIGQLPDLPPGFRRRSGKARLRQLVPRTGDADERIEQPFGSVISRWNIAREENPDVTDDEEQTDDYSGQRTASPCQAIRACSRVSLSSLIESLLWEIAADDTLSFSSRWRGQFEAARREEAATRCSPISTSDAARRRPRSALSWMTLCTTMLVSRPITACARLSSRWPHPFLPA